MNLVEYSYDVRVQYCYWQYLVIGGPMAERPPRGGMRFGELAPRIVRQKEVSTAPRVS